jgi:predicted aspartyl protease
VIHVLFAALLGPSEVLAKARAAVGAPAPGIYRIETRETLNDDTILYVRIEQGDNFVETEHDGEFTTAEGRLDSVNWAQNANGIVVRRTTASMIDDPYVTALGAPDVGSGALHVEDDTAGNIVLVVAPRRGLSKRYTYDAKTFLLLRVDYDDPAGRRAYVFSEYKRYFGAMFPARVAYTSPYANNSATYDLVAYDRVPAASVSLAIPASKPVFDLGSRTSLPIPVTFSRDGIVVRVNVAGRGLDFILDSGASESVIDADVARDLGLSVHGKRTLVFLGTTTVSQTMIDDLSLGEIHAPHFAIAVIPFSRQADEKKVVGLLGGDFFASARIAIDFGAKTVTMLGPTAQLPTDGWTKLPIQVTSFVPATTAAFSGFKGTFIVDTGSWSTVFYRHYFEKFTPDKIGGVQGKVSGIAGSGFDYRSYYAPRIDIGDLAFADVLVQVIDPKAGDDLSIDGLLGRTFLQNFSLIFDYAGQTLYIKSELSQ